MGKKKEVDIDAVVKSTTDKYKRRLKKVCACGTIWSLLGLAAIVIGIIFLVFFAKYWDDEKNWKRNLANAGVGLIIGGIVLIAIGVVFFVALWVVYKRLTGRQKDAFQPPVYEYGKAPYPQQPPWPQPDGNPDMMSQGSPGPHAPLQPPNPNMPSAPPADQSNIHIEVAPHDKF